MENLSPRIVKHTNQNLGFGLVVKVGKTWLFIVLVLMPKSLLACWGGGAGAGGGRPGSFSTTELPINTLAPHNYSSIGVLPDDTLKINLTGIKNPLERIIKTAWNGWAPTNETVLEWRNWYLDREIENKKYEDPDHPGVSDDNRGPGSGWPKLNGWAGLGLGNPGEPVPPWAYVPKNIGRPTICYLPPIEGKCGQTESKGETGERYGFNPYTDQCEVYIWSGCGGTRNRFTTQKRCEEYCKVDPPQTCSAVSAVHDKLTHQFDIELKKDNKKYD